MTIDDKAKEHADEIISSLNELIRKDQKQLNPILVSAVKLIERQSERISTQERMIRDYENSGVSDGVRKILEESDKEIKRITDNARAWEWKKK